MAGLLVEKKRGGGGINAWWIAPMPPLNSMKVEKCKIWTAFQIPNLTITSMSIFKYIYFTSQL